MKRLIQFINEDKNWDAQQLLNELVKNFFFSQGLTFNKANITFDFWLTPDEKLSGTVAVTDLLEHNNIRIRFDKNADIQSDKVKVALLHELIHVYLARKYPDKYGQNSINANKPHDAKFKEICKKVSDAYGEEIPLTVDKNY